MENNDRQLGAKDVINIMDKLIGGVCPSGDAHFDGKSNENLEVYCNVFYHMYREIRGIASDTKHRGQESILKAQKIAKETLNLMTQYDQHQPRQLNKRRTIPQ